MKNVNSRYSLYLKIFNIDCFDVCNIFLSDINIFRLFDKKKKSLLVM